MIVNKENILNPWSEKEALPFEGEKGYFGNTLPDVMASISMNKKGEMEINHRGLYVNTSEESPDTYEYFLPYAGLTNENIIAEK